MSDPSINNCIHCHQEISYFRKLANLEKDVISCSFCHNKSKLVYKNIRHKFVYKTSILITSILTLASIPWFPYAFPVGVVALHYLALYPYKKLKFKKVKK